MIQPNGTKWNEWNERLNLNVNSLSMVFGLKKLIGDSIRQWMAYAEFWDTKKRSKWALMERQFQICSSKIIKKKNKLIWNIEFGA